MCQNSGIIIGYCRYYHIITETYHQTEISNPVYKESCVYSKRRKEFECQYICSVASLPFVVACGLNITALSQKSHFYKLPLSETVSRECVHGHIQLLIMWAETGFFLKGRYSVHTIKYGLDIYCMHQWGSFNHLGHFDCPVVVSQNRGINAQCLSSPKFFAWSLTPQLISNLIGKDINMFINWTNATFGLFTSSTKKQIQMP